MKKTTLLLAIAATLGLSSTAMAEHSQEHTESPFSYNNVSVGYTSLDVDGADETFNGFKAGLVKSIGASNFYVALKYSLTEADFMGTTIEFTQEDYGVGYAHSFNEKFDLNVEAAIIGVEAEANGFISEDAGYRAGVVGRYMVMPKFEAFAGIDMNMYDDSDNEMGYKIGGKYNITSNFDLVAEYDMLEDSSAWTIGAAFRW